MPSVGNWISENSATTGTGPVVVSGAISVDKARFRDVFPSGEVWYSIIDGDSREAGIGVFNGTNTITRVQVSATFKNLIYNDTNPTALNLSGSAIVSCTFNTAAYDELLALIGQNASDLAPILAKRLINFEGAWIDGTTYVQDDQVSDEGYTGIVGALTTDDSPAPQETGPALNVLDATNFATLSDVSIIKMVVDATFTESGFMKVIQIRTPFWDLDSVTRVTFVNLTNSTAEIITNPILSSGEYVNIAVGNLLVQSGDQIQIWFEYYNSSAAQSINGGWTSAITTGIPAVSAFTIDSVTNPTVIEISHTDLDAGDRSTELDGVAVDSIITMSETADVSRSVEAKVVTIDTVSATSTKYTVTLIQTGQFALRDARTCTINIDIPINQPSQYELIAGHWGSVQPSFATVVSELYFDGVQQPSTTDAYPINFIFQPAYVSPDYFIFVSPDSGGGGGGTSFAVIDDLLGTGDSVNALSANQGYILDQAMNISTRAVVASTSLVLADRNNAVEINNAGAVTFTVDSAISPPAGMQVILIATGAGAITLTTAGSTTFRAAGNRLTTAEQNSPVTLYHIGSNVWQVMGDLI